MNIPFSPPDISEAEIAAVTDVLRSGWITTGPKTKELEQNLADYIGTEYCVCLNSQTACAELALRLLGIGPGDEVITTAYTYTATASVICHVGATPVLVDTQPDTPFLCYEQVEAAITEKTKAIIPVDLAGIPCDYDILYRMVEAKRHLFHPTSDLQKAFGRIVILADAAHALGAIRNGIPVGRLADFSAFSFHAVKNLTTAEGGALTWKPIPGVSDQELYRTLQLMSLHGQSKDALAKTKPGAWEYDIVGTWYKYNLTDIAAAIGLTQLKRYDAMLDRRHAIIQRYDTALRPLGVITLSHMTEAYRSSGHLYLTRIPGITAEQRSEIITKMAEQGIACNVHYKPLPMHTAYRNLGFDPKNYPNACTIFANEITLPLHTKLADDEVQYVIDCFTKTVEEYSV